VLAVGGLQELAVFPGGFDGGAEVVHGGEFRRFRRLRWLRQSRRSRRSRRSRQLRQSRRLRRWRRLRRLRHLRKFRGFRRLSGFRGWTSSLFSPQIPRIATQITTDYTPDGKAINTVL